MPPTRGHDLKQKGWRRRCVRHCWMPPTRGHDLKRDGYELQKQAKLRMPPTRGHDLKHSTNVAGLEFEVDAPHTGARLETQDVYTALGLQPRCPPHGGTT